MMTRDDAEELVANLLQSAEIYQRHGGEFFRIDYVASKNRVLDALSPREPTQQPKE